MNGVNMKSMMSRTTVREIRQSFGRYMAIFGIVALGVGFFSGLKVTKPAMLSAAQDYMENYNFYDYRLISTLGFKEEDVGELAGQEDVEAVEGAIAFDILCLDREESVMVLKAHSLTENVNQVEVLAGRLPEQANECVGDVKIYSEEDIGSIIVLSEDNEEEDLENFRYREYVITGIVRTPYYIQDDRGTTSLGNGKISGFLYLMQEGFDVDYYTEIFVKFTEDFPLYGDEYKDFLSEREAVWEEITEIRAQVRYQDILDEAGEEIADARAELEEKKTEAEVELADAKEELDDAAGEIVDGEQEIVDAEVEIADAEKEIADGEQELRDAEVTLAEEEEKLRDGEQELKDAEVEWAEGNSAAMDGRKMLNSSQDELNNQLAAIEAQEALLDGQEAEINENEAMLNAAVAFGMYQETDAYVVQTRAALEGGRAEIAGYRQQIAAGKETIADYQEQLEHGKRNVASAEKELSSAWQQIQDGWIEIEDGKVQIEEARIEIEDGWAELADARKKLADAKKELAEGKQELEDGKQEYGDGLKEYEDALIEFNEEIADAEAKLADAEQELADLGSPDVYVLGRDTNLGYVYFESDSDVVEGIANVFPIFFFLVAALVCITTMNRMVEEQRTQIGVLKALGYGESTIMWKYIFYSGSAAVFGCIFGYMLCTWLFPIVIWNAYGMMYDMGQLHYVYDMNLALISIIVSLLCSIGTTWISCRYEMLTVAADLMRPKSPKAGKRVLLEYIPFIWKRMKFLRKVSLRNLFRYKRRFLMMIVGISGCTALLLTGFGIKDSIANVATMQYTEIQIYDISANFREEADDSVSESLSEAISPYGGSYTYVYEKSLDLHYDGNMKSINLLIVKEEDSIADYVDFHTTGGQPIDYPQMGEAVITHKIAGDYNIKTGDLVTLRDENMNEIQVTISGVSENFVYSYIYISEETYISQMQRVPQYKAAYINFDEEVDVHQAAADVMKTEEVSSVTINQDVQDRISKMMVSLDYIVLLVIICAASLAFIVLYNLTNINITERIREIATIKVLGFYKKESESYVFRENTILSVLGAGVGLLLGFFLHRFVMNEIDVNMIAFDIRVSPLSYLYSFLMTMLFTWCVNRLMSVKLDRINMAESLKSVD